MGRLKKAENRIRLNVWLGTAQIRQIERFSRLYGKDKTAIVSEAIQYWLNTQYSLHGKQLEKLSSELGVE